MSNVKANQHLGMVYAMSNSVTNKVIAFYRGVNGKLSYLSAYATGGNGTGEAKVDPLSSQSSLCLSNNNRYLFAVNAGSNNITSFRISNSGGLTRTDLVDSGGIRPNSLCTFGDLLYATNAGSETSASRIVGYRIGMDGRLTRIEGATYSLSRDDAQPACIASSPNGKLLVVSELNTNLLSVFTVNQDGTLTGPVINNSNGQGPFGSAFLSTGILLVSEAGANALSSYNVTGEGVLNVISRSVLNGQKATCWVNPTPNNLFAFTSNAGSGTITTYRIKRNGTLSMMNNTASTRGRVPASPIDNAVSRDGKNLYVLNGNKGSVSVFRINKDGHLVRLQVIKGQELPMLGAQGLAVI
ncbi:MAG: lactonase family protein [Methylocystaceae bacterium]